MSNTTSPIVIGAVQLPCYGRVNPKIPLSEVEEYALRNVGVFYDNGIRTLYIQDEDLNRGDAYPETIAVLSSVGRSLKYAYPDLQLGFVIQAHDGIAPIACATACGADFVRIKVFVGSLWKAEGLRDGVGIDAVNYRTAIGSSVKILADVYDREGAPVPGVPLEMAIGWADHVGADGFVLTGHNWEETLSFLDVAKGMGLDKPVIVGGSVDEHNIAEVLERSDGAVISSSLMLDAPEEGSLLRWDGRKVRRFVDKVRSIGRATC